MSMNETSHAYQCCSQMILLGLRQRFKLDFQTFGSKMVKKGLEFKIIFHAISYVCTSTKVLNLLFSNISEQCD